MSKALQYLGIARMSGNIELGEEQSKALVKAGKARALLLASDASEGVRKRAEGYVYGFRAPLIVLPYTKAELGGAVGRAQCAVAAIRDLGLAKSLADALADALAAEHGEAYAPAAAALGETQRRIRARKSTRGSKGTRRKSE